jgi:nicotinate-nucleotide adenylyltransferase
MGTDILAGFDRWREPAEILRLARIAAFWRDPVVSERVRVPPVTGLADRLSVFDAGSVRITATDVRNDLAQGRSVAGKVPGPVAEYITKHGLYKPGVRET